MSKLKAWSQAAASLEKACEDEHLAAKWQESFVRLCRNQQDECRIEKLSPIDAALLILHSLGRGHALIKQAEDWNQPAIGSSKGSSKLNHTRGIMWRYVMAYCGWEQCTKSLGLTQKTQNSILSQEYRLRPISLSIREANNISSWIPQLLTYEIENSTSNCFMADFLGLGENYKEFPLWIMGVKTEITDAQILAILRNIVVHGSLSPTKAREWRMVDLYVQARELILVSLEKLLTKIIPL